MTCSRRKHQGHGGQTSCRQYVLRLSQSLAARLGFFFLQSAGVDKQNNQSIRGKVTTEAVMYSTGLPISLISSPKSFLAVQRLREQQLRVPHTIHKNHSLN